MRNRFLLAWLIGVCMWLTACAPSNGVVDNGADAGRYETDRVIITVTGSGPDVILVPGLASNVAVWDTTVTALERDFRLHTVQVRGFGGEPYRGELPTADILKGLAEDVSAYAAQLNQPPALIGHSLGGLVVLLTALKDQSTINRLMVIDVLPFFSVMIDEAATADSIGPVAAGLAAVMANQTDAQFEAGQRAGLMPLVADPDGFDLALSWSLASDRAFMARAMQDVLVTDLREDIRALKIPVTVLYARSPQIENMHTVERFYQSDYAMIDEVKLQPIDGSRHFIMFDQPDAFFAAVRDFLSDPVSQPSE